MSCSQFIEHEEEDKNDTLVIILNGDGTVTVDPLTLERVLSQQRRAAISVVRFENTNEPDSQTEKVEVAKDEKAADDKDKPCRKVNLVVEGYYPSSLNANDKNTTESVVSSTVGTPPLPQTTSEFLDLLSEGLEIPVSQLPTQSNMHTTAGDGCIGDSLIDAFSEMAPEQLKQVETALHSEKAKQILGDDVTSVLDTLKLNEEQDDWVHLDHCYTNLYGSKKHNQPERVQNVVVQDSDVATMLTIKVGSSDDKSVSTKKDSSALSVDTSNSSVENLELTLPENIEIVNISPPSSDVVEMSLKKKLPPAQNRPKMVTGGKAIPFKGTLPNHAKEALNSARRERPVPPTQKIKRKSKEPTKNIELPERIVTEDEVDGVKVFKPTRNDKRSIKSFLYKDGLVPPPKSQLVQSKLNFGKKVDATSSDHDKFTMDASKSGAESKKETPRKSLTPEIFGPALFSTPDIIRKINTDEASTSPKNEEKNTITDDETAEIEKRMSALENGEAILDQLHLQVEMQKEMERITSQSDDDKLLSDLENSADEDQMEEHMVTSTPLMSYQPSLQNLDMEDSESEYMDKSENSERNEGEYEDDPNKLWCLCNKPHNNRFMICCDACDNWFHGVCVGITKATGEKMEKNGTEWLCPSCKKEKYAKEREKKLKTSFGRITASKLAGRHSTTESANTTISSSTNTSIDESLSTTAVSSIDTPTTSRKKSISLTEKPFTCIECKEKEAMPNAAYCSNECILNHVTNSLNNLNSGQRIPLSEDKKIIMFDRKANHSIGGLRAPSVSNLREWILQHPSYEIVRPSALPTSYASTFSKPIPKKTSPVVKGKEPIIKSRGQLIKSKVNEDPVKPADPTQSSMKQFLVKRPSQDDDKRDLMKIKIKKTEDITNIAIKDGTPKIVKKDDPRLKDKPRQIKIIPVQPLSKPEEQKDKPIAPVTKKIVPPSPTPEKKKKIELPIPPKEKVVPKKVEIKRPEVKKKEPVAESTPVPVSQGLDAVLRESVRKRLSELFNSKIKESNDIKMNEVEALALATQIEVELYAMIKDVAKYKTKYRSLHFNIKEPQNTLFKRLVENSLSPYELVRLTPEELACTELAQWREREAKHEIDMIKKTELENLSATKVLVVKTHKGELEIESQSLPPCKSDLIVPDLQPDEVPEEKDKSKKTLPYYFSKDKERGAKDKSKDDHTDKKDRDKERDKHKKHDRKDKHRSSKHRRRSSEREKHRSRSRRRSKSPDKEHLHSTSPAKSSHRSSSVEKTKSDKDSHRNAGKMTRSRSRSHKRKEKSPEKIEEKVKVEPEPEPEKVEEEKPVDLDEDKVPAELLNPFKSVDVDLSDMEPTSTVTIKTPPYAHSPETPSSVWKGTVVMPDVVDFHTTLKEVSGNCEGLDEDLQSFVECIGRITPHAVWEYISKVKKSGSKEILVLRFESADAEDRSNYFSLYSYLSTKNRMAVVGNAGPAIKDFYVMPLASHSPVPQVLLPLDGPGFEDYKPHLLLAVIVRNRRKKYHTTSIIPQPSTSSLQKKIEHEPYVPPIVPHLTTQPVQEDSFTPPHSPTSVFVNTQIPITTTIAKNDEDEPYSPEDDEPYSPSAIDDEGKASLEDSNSQLDDSKPNDSANSSAPSNDADRPELYSPSEHFFNDIESSKVTLPGELQKLFYNFKSLSNTSEPSPSTSGSGTILETDPIVDAYKKSGDNQDDDIEDATLEEPSYSPPPVVEDEDEDVCEESPKEKEPEKVEIPEFVEEPKSSRDPRRKAVDTFRTPVSAQPPPPGMEDEFSPPGISKQEASMTGMQEAGYTTMPATYTYATAQGIPPYTAMMPQMYLTTTPVYPQGTALPFTAMPPPTMYVPATMMHRTDPSLIPLPMESADSKKSDKRKMDDDKETDNDEKKSDKSKKHKSYYTSDSKANEARTSPTRHHSSGYDAHRRGYQRDDAEYSTSSRYGHKYGRSYRDRDRNSSGGYWKSGSDYSSSSSHKKYSHSSSTDRDRSSSSKRNNRWDNSSSTPSKQEHEEENWDEEIDQCDTKKDKDKSDSGKKSESK